MKRRAKSVAEILLFSYLALSDVSIFILKECVLRFLERSAAHAQAPGRSLVGITGAALALVFGRPDIAFRWPVVFPITVVLLLTTFLYTAVTLLDWLQSRIDCHPRLASIQSVIVNCMERLGL